MPKETHETTGRRGKPKPRDKARRFGPRSPAARRPDVLWIYGFHPVLAALANPRRQIHRILATTNALARLTGAGASFTTPAEPKTPRDLDRLLGADAVHQGVAVEVAPLPPTDIDVLAGGRLAVVLDQVTDPHNVGAILRSAVAFGADAVVTTQRHAPTETGVLAKAASGALDTITWIAAPNLARALDDLRSMGFTLIGLDSDADRALDAALTGSRIALVLGAEGKGLRQLTQQKCDLLAHIPLAGSIASLNVSNAAAVALYASRRHLDSQVR